MIGLRIDGLVVSGLVVNGAPPLLERTVRRRAKRRREVALARIALRSSKPHGPIKRNEARVIRRGLLRAARARDDAFLPVSRAFLAWECCVRQAGESRASPGSPLLLR